MKTTSTTRSLWSLQAISTRRRQLHGIICFSLALFSFAHAQNTKKTSNNYFKLADTLRLDIPASSAFSKDDLVDCFIFNVQATAMYNCNSFCNGEKYNLSGAQVEVVSAKDTTQSVLHGNPSGRYGQFGFRLAGWLPPNSGWYYVRIRYTATLAAADSVPYQMRLAFGAPLTTIALLHENDNTVDQAKARDPIPTDGSLVHGYLYKKTGLYNWNDLDLYRCEGEKNQSLTAETFTAAQLTNEPWFIRDTDTELALLDQDGNVLVINDDKETTSADPWENTLAMNNTFSRFRMENLPYTGVYYIRVNSFYNSITQHEDSALSDSNPGGGEYLLSVKLTQTSSATVAFDILNQDNGMPLPGKMTAMGVAGTETQDLFKFLHTIDGHGNMNLPAGVYTICFSHGPEYSLVQQPLILAKGETVKISARLRPLLDTKGYIGGDFHLHALEGIEAADKFGVMLSGLVGEGVEYAVATDHNAISDYQPRVAEMGLQNLIKTSVGDEISTAIGHINAWPLHSTATAVLVNVPPAGIFADARTKGAKIVQINHPRWPGIDYFTAMNLDTLTGYFTNPLASEDFDAMELMNETEGWGFDVIPPNSPISVVQDWFHLLNRGKRYCATGNSDAHGLNGDKPGYPRNYMASSTDKPGEIDEDELLQSIRHCRVTVCDGHFTTFTVNGSAQIGDQITDSDGTVRLSIRVQALPEISVDRVQVFGNGIEVAAFDVPASTLVDRFVQSIELHPTRDTWYSVISRGNTSIPIGLVQDDSGPIKPAGYTNPIWVDVDGNGVFNPPGLPTEVQSSTSAIPQEFSLLQNYPNPFNPSTTIAFTLPREEQVSIKLFTVLGKEIGALVNERLDAGNHKVVWHAGHLSNGVYFITLQAGEFKQTRKAILMK